MRTILTILSLSTLTAFGGFDAPNIVPGFGGMRHYQLSALTLAAGLTRTLPDMLREYTVQTFLERRAAIEAAAQPSAEDIAPVGEGTHTVVAPIDTETVDPTLQTPPAQAEDQPEALTTPPASSDDTTLIPHVMTAADNAALVRQLTQETPDYGMGDLPDELLLPILQMLPTRNLIELALRTTPEHQEANTCPRLRRLIQDPSLMGPLPWFPVIPDNSDDITPIQRASIHLLWAAHRGHLRLVEHALDMGADINTTNQHAFTPLHLAAMGGHLPVVELLLERGADLNVLNFYNCTPLFLAVGKGHLWVAQLLLDRGADVNAQNLAGYTPLHLAADRGYLKVAVLLLKRGATHSASTENIVTPPPLHLAASNGHVDVVELLIHYGADVYATNIYGQTPLFMAKANGHEDVAKILEYETAT